MAEGVKRAEQIEADFNSSDCWLDGSSAGQNAGAKAIAEIFIYAMLMEKTLAENGFQWTGTEWVKA